MDLRRLNRNELVKLAKAVFEYNSRQQRNPLSLFKPHPYQEAFWNSIKNERWVFGGNRTGKTVNGAADVIQDMIDIPGTDAWACTWADLSIPVQQKAIYDLLPKDKLSYCKYSVQRGFANRVISFTNGSVLRFKTYDQGWESFQGAARDKIWNDEEPPYDIYKEQKARLIDRNGKMINTMTPINGMTWVYDRIVTNKAIRDLIDFWFWHTEDNPSINQDAFRNIIGMYNAKEAEVRSKGSFLNLASGRCYWAFDRSINMRPLRVDSSLPLRLSFDFNVNPMTTGIYQIVRGRNKYEQELILNLIQAVNTEDCNTNMQCEILAQMLRNWNGDLIIYGDASNPRRTETANVNDTNWTIVKQYFPNAEYKVPNSNPNIKERVSWTNSKIYNYDKKIGMYINTAGCEAMIKDLENVKWHKNGKEKDKSNPSLNHNSDHLDYIIAEEFPLQPDAFGVTDLLAA